MTLSYRFFSNGDYYTQPDFAKLMKDSLSDGYVRDVGDELLVIAATPATMSVEVKTGRGYIQGYSFDVEDTAYPLSISAADPDNPRIDRIVARLSVTVSQDIQLAVLTGTPDASPQPPALTRNSETYEISLAQVYIGAGATSVVSSNITDERLNFSVCGIAGVKHAWRDSCESLKLSTTNMIIDREVSHHDPVRFDGVKWVKDNSECAWGVYDELNNIVCYQGNLSGYTDLVPGTNVNAIATAVDPTSCMIAGNYRAPKYTIRIFKGKSATSGEGVVECFSSIATDITTTPSGRENILRRYARHCLIPNGVTEITTDNLVYLDEDNFGKDVDGNSVNLDGTDGDLMLEVDRLYWRVEDHATYFDIEWSPVKMSEDMICASVFNGTERRHIYYGVFNGWKDSNGALRSVSTSNVPENTKTIDTFYSYAQTRGTSLTENTFCIENALFFSLRQILTLWVYATKDVQGDVVCGLNNGSGSAASALLACNSGFSATGGWTQGTTADYNTCCMALGIMNPWGKQWQFIGETIFNGGAYKFAYDGADHYAVASGTFAGAPATWINTGAISPAGSSGQYISEIAGNLHLPCVPSAASGASSSSYYCDIWYYNSGDRCCMAGAAVDSSSGMAGAFALSCYAAVSYSYWSLGARLCAYGGE